jgi:predicted esterase
MARVAVSKKLAFSLAYLVFVGVALTLVKPAHAKSDTAIPDPMVLEVPDTPEAFYYKPLSKGQRPILMYLHGRGGNPFEDCRKWAKVARRFGWVVCPQGQVDRGNGDRAWANDATTAKKIVDAVVVALKKKYKGRVRTRGDVLIGFSEGAFVAQQIGLRDPDRWNRWLILAANDQYWFGDAPQLLEENHHKIRRVFLFTGESDMVAENTLRAGDMLKNANIPVRVKIAPGMGHEVPADRMITNYRRPLLWLIRAK